MHATIADLLSEIAMNAIESGAGHIEVTLRTTRESIEVIITDNGKGMDQATLASCCSPRTTDQRKHAARSVGLGLPFLLQGIEATGGHLDIDSAPGKGARVHFAFDTRHIDTPPTGNMTDTLLTALAYPGAHELNIRRETASGCWSVSRSELIDALGDLEHASCLNVARRYLADLEAGLLEMKAS